MVIKQIEHIGAGIDTSLIYDSSLTLTLTHINLDIQGSE